MSTTITEIVESMKAECPAEYFVSAEALEKLLSAVGEYVEDVASVLHEDAVCDHSVGICACEYWRKYENLQFQIKAVTGKLRTCRSCNSKFDPDQQLIGGRGKWEFQCDNCWDLEAQNANH